MRVLFVAHSFPRFPGDSAGSFVLRLAQALAGEHVTVEALAPAATGLAGCDTVGGVPVQRYRYAPESWETLAYTGNMAADVAASLSGKLAMAGLIGAAALATRARIRARDREPVDLVHAHWWFPSGVAAALALSRSRTPLVTTSHGSDIRLLLQKPAATPAARFVFARSRAVTCVSEWLANGVSTYTVERPVVAPMPVDTALFAPTAAGSEGRNPRLILFAGRLTRQKGGEAAIRALVAMRADATLDIIGTGPEHDRLVQLVRELGVGSRVRLLGAATQQELAVAYRQAAVLLMPSLNEGLGLVAAEAQLSETPVVGYASGGIPDVVRSGETGLLVPPGDIAALAAALDTLVTNPALRESLGRNARAATLARFSPGASAARYAALYRSVLARRAP